MFGLPGRLGTEREAAFEKRREPQRSEAQILHVIFLQGICRLQSCNVPGILEAEPEQKAATGWLELAETCQDYIAQESVWRGPSKQQEFSTKTSRKAVP